MISVVIPLYNKAFYIKECIHSVLNQSYFDFEIIVIDDGSTDNSPNIVKQIHDSRIRLISQENAGVSAARNKGVLEAKFPYVAFLDADDCWDISFLKEMTHLIKKYPDAGMYACKYKKFINNNIIDVPIKLENFYDGYIDYIHCCLVNINQPIWSSAVIVEKKSFQKIGGFNSCLICGEDQELWLRMAVNFKTCYLNKFLSYYNLDRILPEGSIIKKNVCLPKEQFFIFNLDYFLSLEKENTTLAKLLDVWRLRNLKPYYMNNVYSKEVKSILKSIKYFPIKFILFYKSPYILVKFIYSFYNYVKQILLHF